MPRHPLEDLDRLIGASICRLRIERGLTQQQLGRSLGVCHRQIQKYECGDDPIAASDLILVAIALGISLDRIWQDVLTAYGA